MNIEDDILIEHFLRNKLSENDREQVLARINTDVVFKEKVDFERELFESLNDEDWYFLKNYNKEEVKEYVSILKTKELIDLKTELKRVNENFKNSEANTPFNWKRVLVSSAALIAIVLSSYFLLPQNKTPQDLYNKSINLEDMPSLVTRGDGDNELLKAQHFFEAANYRDALTMFSKAKQDNATILLYKGIAEMQLDEFDAAEATFNGLIQSDYLDAQKGYWYKALLYLKKEDLEKAKVHLNEIVYKGYYNYKKAEKLLESI